MAATEVTVLVVYAVWTGDGSGSYDAVLAYDEWDEAALDIKAALDRRRSVLVERSLTTRAEYDEPGPASDASVRQLRGEAP